MKKTLLITKKAKLSLALLTFCLCFNFGWSQTELVQNGNCQGHTISTSDNADTFDMTPPSTVDNGVSSPYRAVWNNGDLDSWLNTNCGDSNEQPGSSSDGSWDYSAGPTMGVKTRGVKISSACRRLYQKIAVTAGTEYTFSIESRSEAQNVPSEVFILNTEITSETGLSSTSTTVDSHFNITNDFNSSKSNATTNNFTTTTFDFTASGSFIVIYVRAPLAIDSSNEVFYDNISLVEKQATASVDDVFASKVSVHPNPAKDFITISSDVQINKVEVYNLLGKRVINFSKLSNNNLDISSLSKGIYMMKLTSGNSVASKKIIKK